MRTPFYVIDKDLVEANLKVLRGVMDRTGCRILLAQKAFSCYALYPLVAKYLSGAAASGLHEAMLCHEEMPSAENHIFSPAFREEDMEKILSICDHIVFNSPRQLSIYGRRAKEAGLQVGLRINPEFSTQTDHAIYDPCAPGSRLGTRFSELEDALAADHSLMDCLDGFHFHTLCEQDSDDLEATLAAVEARFGRWMHGMKWINFGGGHHITRPGYDIPRLERCIAHIQEEYGLQVYLEPGEAIALNAGFLHASVLEVRPTGDDGVTNVILDTSAACHMPDVIEMPYTPPLKDAEEPGRLERDYRLGGPTCLSGDIIGCYSMDRNLKEGDILVFKDMAIYSMVKNNTFNGMPLPAIYIREGGTYRLWKEFSYQDFKSRL